MLMVGMGGFSETLVDLVSVAQNRRYVQKKVGVLLFAIQTSAHQRLNQIGQCRPAEQAGDGNPQLLSQAVFALDQS
jgi:hypothetical protein